MQLLVSKWPAFTSFQSKAVLQSSIGFECAQGSLMPHHRRGGLSPFKPRLARGTFGQLHCRNKPVRDANWQARRAERLACPHLEESSPAKGPSSRRILQITLALPKSRAAPSLPMAFAVGGLLWTDLDWKMLPLGWVSSVLKRLRDLHDLRDARHEACISRSRAPC